MFIIYPNIERIQNTIDFCANHFVVISFYRSAQLDRLPCAGSYLAYNIPGHALHEKGLQRQKGVGTLVSSQEQRALLVPVINRGKTADKPRISRWSNAGSVPLKVFPDMPCMKRVYRDK